MLRIATVSDLLSYFAICQEIAGTLICFVYFWLKLTQSSAYTRRYRTQIDLKFRTSDFSIAVIALCSPRSLRNSKKYRRNELRRQGNFRRNESSRDQK